MSRVGLLRVGVVVACCALEITSKVGGESATSVEGVGKESCVVAVTNTPVAKRSPTTAVTFLLVTSVCAITAFIRGVVRAGVLFLP